MIRKRRRWGIAKSQQTANRVKEGGDGQMQKIALEKATSGSMWCKSAFAGEGGRRAVRPKAKATVGWDERTRRQEGEFPANEARLRAKASGPRGDVRDGELLVGTVVKCVEGVLELGVKAGLHVKVGKETLPEAASRIRDACEEVTCVDARPN